MLGRSRELWLSALAIALITLLYLSITVRLGSIPAAREFFGHSLGILGFLLMIMTELLYSLRKRQRHARWGRMASWLQFHIFTGLVGPYLVLLHTSWKFNGLAGMVFLLTAVIVLSGFIGRYIYTAVPRTADGAELQTREISERMRILEEEIAAWITSHPPAAQAFRDQMEAAPARQESGVQAVWGRAFSEFLYRLAVWREQRRLDRNLRDQTARLAQMEQQRRALQRQMNSLAAARRMLATWHAVHIPIGMALFTAAFIHILAAIYYATLLH